MEQKSLPEVEEFRYLDPKLLRPPGSEAPSVRSRNTFQEAVVFVVGGGNYIEYQNLVDYTKVGLLCVVSGRGLWGRAL